MASSPTASGKLKKELGLWDVYCISTGAMFSSGFFLLPGLATATAGPSTVLAYLLAGLLIIPSMLSMVELSTALPKAGGAYYFLDRSLGPLVGTIGGLGTWLSLVLKSGFALVGMGAYLAIIPGVDLFFDVNSVSGGFIVKAVAVVLAVVFALVNIFGAKSTTKLQSILVMVLLAVLGLFIVQGLVYVFFELPEGEIARQYTPFLHEDNGLGGLISTVGLVFVSYAGLTKVASVSEEVKRPDRNLPLGMFLSLATASMVYVVGVFIMIAVLQPDALRSDYTPVATAAESFFHWLPQPWGLILVVAAALAAFASTGNAGIMSASRYPLAMARDKLVSARFEKLNKFGTPTAGILVTTALMIFFILAFSAQGVAKLASSFNLLVFGLANIAVIVMRESKIESYDPGFRVPLYPFLPLAGALISGWLIAEMGTLAILFSLGVVAVGVVWYLYYARQRVDRSGAIHHVFERLGRERHQPLYQEFQEIIKEKGLRAKDPFDATIAKADVFDADPQADYATIVHQAAECLSRRVPINAEELAQRFMNSGELGEAPIAHGAILPHFRSENLTQSEMVLVRSASGVYIARSEAQATPSQNPDDADVPAPAPPQTAREVYALIFLVSPQSDPGQHLRVLAQVASRVEDATFMTEWRDATDHQKLREVLLQNERFAVIHVGREALTLPMADKTIAQLDLPAEAQVSMIRRDGRVFVPGGHTTILNGDRLTIIGGPAEIKSVRQLYLTPGQIEQVEAKIEAANNDDHPDDAPPGQG